MKSPRRETYIRKILDEWEVGRPFTAAKFADEYNVRYSHYSIPSSGFYTYFLTLEREGKLQIIHSEGNRNNKYMKLDMPKEDGNETSD